MDLELEGDARHPAESAPDMFRLGRDRERSGEWEQATEAYLACLDAAEAPGLAGLAAFRAATVLGQGLGRWEDAEAACVRGIARDPRRPELYWLAGYAAACRDGLERAADWASVAVALNHAADDGLISEHEAEEPGPARREAPWDLLRFVLEARGDAAGARRAEAERILAPSRQDGAERRRRLPRRSGLAELAAEIRRDDAEACRETDGS